MKVGDKVLWTLRGETHAGIKCVIASLTPTGNYHGTIVSELDSYDTPTPVYLDELQPLTPLHEVLE